VQQTASVATKGLQNACALMLIALWSAACSTAADDLDRAALEAEVLEWRESRRASLMAPTGFLTLAGLFWLDEEITTFGSASDNDLVFPSTADDARIPGMDRHQT
jgi:hypothetical protein